MTVTRYRKRPVEVDTIQWTGRNIDELIAFTGGDFLLVDQDEGGFTPDITAKVYDNLHDTWVGVKTGQHVVRGVKGEFYTIAEDVLAETYVPAGVAPATDEAVVEQVARHLDGWEMQSSRTRVPRAELARELVAIVQASHAPATDRAALVELGAQAIWAQYADAEPSRNGLVMANPHAAAAAVLAAVLPSLADRAAVLREAADVLWNHPRASATDSDFRGASDVLRRMATDSTPATGHDDSETQCTAARAPFGRTPADPCVVKGSHREHATADGFRWTVEVVHGCPPDGSGLTPCCGRTPFELPLTDRISSEAPVTCPGPAAGQAAALERIRGIARRLAAHAVGFQDALDDSDRNPWADTVRADIAALVAALDEVAAL